MSTTTRNIIVELNKDEKLNGDNYKIWYCKVQYNLEKQETLETPNHVMQEPKQGNTAQHRRDQEAYMAWKKKSSLAHIVDPAFLMMRSHSIGETHFLFIW